MIPWRTGRLFVTYVFLLGVFLVFVIGLRQYPLVVSVYDNVATRLQGRGALQQPIADSRRARSAPRPLVNPVLTIPSNPSSIFAN